MSGTRKRRRRRSEGQWRELVSQWKSGDASCTEFCERHDVSPTSLYAWQSRLSGDRPDVEHARPDAFLPVTMVDPKPSQSTEPKGWVEIVTHSGRVVRVHGEPDERSLWAVLKVAEQC